MSHRIQQDSNGEYFLYYDDKQHGPFSTAQVRGMYLDRAIHDDTPACQAGMAEWQPLKAVLPDLTQGATPQSTPIQHPLPSRHPIAPAPQRGLSILAVVSLSLVFGAAGVFWGLRQRVAEPPTVKQPTKQTNIRRDAIPLTNPPVSPDASLLNAPLSARLATGGTEAKSESSARFLETKAKADKGDAAAQYELGKCYDDGLGVAQDYSEAIKWYRRAAEQDFAPAQNVLGTFYSIESSAVEKDYTEAAKWYRKAAEQNFAPSQNALGISYTFSNGVPKDFAAAVKWFRMSAEQNFAEAQKNLGSCYFNGQGVAKDYTEAVKWFRKSAEQNFPSAQLALGVSYEDGRGATKDYVEAYAWLNLAAKKMRNAALVRDALEKRMSQQQVSEAQRRTKLLESQIAAKLAK